MSGFITGLWVAVFIAALPSGWALGFAALALVWAWFWSRESDRIAAEQRRIYQTGHDAGVKAGRLDDWSSASRQHFIDTGEYLTPEEVAEYGPATALPCWRDPSKPCLCGGAGERAECKAPFRTVEGFETEEEARKRRVANDYDYWKRAK